MDNQKAYNEWSATYDAVQNKTRDLEATALRESVRTMSGADILEIGCGTGKNTVWLLERAKKLIGADFSEEMLAAARAKIKAENVEFRRMDLRDEWGFEPFSFDLVTASLVLEHLQNIDFVFGEARRVLRNGGIFYLGELHPFKQYLGSKARFETETGIFELECFVHHISEFWETAKRNGFECLDIREWFDDDDETMPPRLLTMIFKIQK